MALATTTYTSSGSFLVPAGVTHVILWGMGGGGGGGGGGSFTTTASSGGTGASLGYTMIAVVPNTSYTVTIGAGGAGGFADTDGSSGSDTTFGALHTFSGSAPGLTINQTNKYGMSGGAGTDLSGQGSVSPYNYATSTAAGSGGAGGRGEGGAGVQGGDDGANGNAAAANTGGGGSSGEHDSAGTGGLGGAGGSGWLQVIWFEG